VVRLNADGSLDTSFNGTGKKTIDFGGSYFGYGVQDAGSGVAVQADGKVVVAGYSFQGRNRADFALARLQADPPLLADSPTFAATSRPPSPASRSPSRPASPACRPSPRR